jgi:hypothetical protein
MGAITMAALCASRADAQTPTSTVPSPAGHGRQLEIALGASFLAPVPMGSRDIAFQAPDGSMFTIAKTTSRAASSVGLDARLGFSVSSRVAIEMAGAWDLVRFQTSESGDIEGAAAGTSSMHASRLTAGGAAVFTFAERPRTTIFALAGARWMREISQVSASGVYDDGAIVDGGAGVKIWWRQGGKGRVKRVGLRLEGRVGVRTGGMSLDEKSAHVITTFFGGLVIGS